MKYTHAQEVDGRGRYQDMLRFRSNLQPLRYSRRAKLAAATFAIVVAAGCAPQVPGPPVNGPVAAPAPSGPQPFAIPAPGVGQATGGTQRGSGIQVPSGDGTGNFRISCRYSHMNYDDSIVYPGQPGRAHLHTYFGNTLSTATSTAQSLLTSGNSTCDGGISNRSSYWVPSLIGANNVAQVPTGIGIYYKSGYQGIQPQEISPTFPNGLKIIAGDARATSPQAGNVSWTCRATGERSAAIPACPQGSYLQAQIVFPQCWDGVNLDSPDHQSHMRYGMWGDGCPASHPVALPEITYNVDYMVGPGGTNGWRLSSDMYSGPGGYSLHADIITAWDPAISSRWLNNCTRQNADCHVGQLDATTELVWAVG
jgi:hypothetical protein